jgi:hypothetical protein
LVGVALCFAAVARPAAAVDLSGCWSGYWQSCTTGHHGPLKADFCRVSSTQYDVRFKGRFFKIIPFRYSVTLDVVSETEDTVKLAGSSFLGRMMGTFTYAATATEDEFVSRYSSCKDKGKFVLSRCCTSCR